MKKAVKIVGITLASLVGVVLIAAAVALAVLNSSSRLTKLVKKYAPQWIECDMELKEAKLNLFEDFPNIGIDIHNAAFLNPMEGSPSDTVANIDQLTLIADAKKLVRDKAIVVRKCHIEDALVNLCTDSTGRHNYDIFKSDDKDKEDKDFDYLVDIEKITLDGCHVFYSDLRNGTSIEVQRLCTELKGAMQDKDISAIMDLRSQGLEISTKALQMDANNLNLQLDGNVTQLDQIKGMLSLATPDITLTGNDSYLKNDSITLNLPFTYSLNQGTLHLDSSQINLNEEIFNIEGDAAIKDKSYNLDLTLNSSNLTIEDVLSRLPMSIQKKLDQLGISGKMQIAEAKVKGTYDEHQMPLITAKVLTEDAIINLQNLPYPFTEVDLDALVSLDLKGVSEITVNQLSTKFNQSKLNVTGTLGDLLGDIDLGLNVKGDVPMSDVKRFLPKHITLAGRTRVDMTTDFTLDQLMKTLKDYDLNRLDARATLKIKDFAFSMDTIQASAPQLDLNLVTPTSGKKDGVHINLASEQLQAQVGTRINGNLDHPVIKANVTRLNGGMEKMDLAAEMQCGQLALVYDTLTAQIESPSFTVTSLPTSSHGLNARINFESKDLEASWGKQHTLNANALECYTRLKQDKAKSGFLNRWNPTIEFVLDEALIKTEAINEDIRINTIDFSLDTSQINLKKSTFSIGTSDLSIEGDITGFKEWMDDHSYLMKGELLLSSDLLNINEIMDITNGLGRSDGEKAEAEADSKGPFMVPEGVDFNFTVKTKKSLYDNFDLNNLSGSLTVKDGTLILEEIGFTNKAAKMLLTAMYQSPRPNHLFLAMDFHLLDVQIRDLLNMIPFIDTLVPMLKTFDGQGEFHIGAETNLKSNYEPKISTLRAAADIEGKNLTVNDKFAFTNITDKLQVSTNGEYRVDSLDVQLTAFKDEIDLWPSQIAIGKYKITVDGRMTLDRNGEYHLSVTETPVFLPNRMGLKLSGPINNLDYELEKPKFPTLYKPNKRNDREQMYYDMKKKIADRLKANVK